jgi:hypothetical protein
MAASDPIQIEAAIRHEMATETSAIRLSNRLFAPGGLFNQFGTSEDEVRAVVNSSLFREALQRVAELRAVEVAAFARVVEAAQNSVPEQPYLFKMESAEQP